MVGCEALLRWNHPTKGTLLPDQFIPIVEKYALENDLLAMVLEQVFSDMSEEISLFHDLTMSINLCGGQLDNPELVTLISEKMKQYQIPATSLEFEITETSLVKNYQVASEQLSRLRQLGIKVAIDDFGTGYASYEVLCELPVDVIKIDGCFIKRMYRNVEHSIAINAIIASAKALELAIVAECVENCRQANFLTDAGVHRLQGFLFSEAITGQILLTLL